MPNQSLRRPGGFTLVELVIVMVVIGILAAVGVRQIGSSVADARYAALDRELTAIVTAISGDPSLRAEGARSSFGYIGDVGALPTSMTNLWQNPGGYTTWNGPYLSVITDTASLSCDPWGTVYAIVSASVRSTGSGSTIEREFGASTSALLGNALTGRIVDASGKPPDSTFSDSVQVLLSSPNGSGGMSLLSSGVDSDGDFGFSSLPVGNRMLRVVYIPSADTFAYPVTILPGKTGTIELALPLDLF